MTLIAHVPVWQRGKPSVCFAVCLRVTVAGVACRTAASTANAMQAATDPTSPQCGLSSNVNLKESQSVNPTPLRFHRQDESCPNGSSRSASPRRHLGRSQNGRDAAGQPGMVIASGTRSAWPGWSVASMRELHMRARPVAKALLSDSSFCCLRRP